MKATALRQADIILSRCGRTVPPADATAFVPLYSAFFYQAVVDTAASQQQPLEIQGEDAPFFLAAISGLQPPVGLDVYVQIMFPTGRIFQQALRDWIQDPGFGSSRCVLDEPVECPPGSKLRIAASTAFASPQTTTSFSVLFEGAYRFYLERSSGRRIPYTELASTLPRTFATRNQNILAPRWMTPIYTDVDPLYFYASPATTFSLPAVAAGVNNFVEVATDSGFEFLMKRLVARTSFEEERGGASGKIYIRLRESNGYMLTDDYVDLAKINGQFLPRWWRIPPGKSVIADLAIFDPIGAGSFTIQLWYEGIRRRPLT